MDEAGGRPASRISDGNRPHRSCRGRAVHRRRNHLVAGTSHHLYADGGGRWAPDGLRDHGDRATDRVHPRGRRSGQASLGGTHGPRRRATHHLRPPRPRRDRPGRGLQRLPARRPPLGAHRGARGRGSGPRRTLVWRDDRRGPMRPTTRTPSPDSRSSMDGSPPAARPSSGSTCRSRTPSPASNGTST